MVINRRANKSPDRNSFPVNNDNVSVAAFKHRKMASLEYNSFHFFFSTATLRLSIIHARKFDTQNDCQWMKLLWILLHTNHHHHDENVPKKKQ